MKKSNSWNFGNEILYNMCRKWPDHTDDQVIAGKIWLIGRAYSASIERKAGQYIVEGDNFYLKRVAPMIRKNMIDGWIEPIKSIKRITTDNVEQVLYVHKRFTDLLKEISGVEKRSLASKYLHFHLPQAFFIYDSIANKKIRNLLPRVRFRVPDNVDTEYAGFVLRCIHFRDTVFENGKRTSPRELDAFLLGY